MGNRLAPSLPTPKQIETVYAAVRAVHPNARIARVGPEGITFDYPDSSKAWEQEWQGKPFSAEGGT